MDGPGRIAFPDQGLVNTHAATLVAAGGAGFLVGGAEGAAAGVVAWTAVLVGCWWFQAHTQVLPEPAGEPEHEIYADFDDFVERLDDLAQERGWNIDKHFGIARMACANRTMTFDELERRYDRGRTSAPAMILPDASNRTTNDVSA
jgi:hypothetical protein